MPDGWLSDCCMVKLTEFVAPRPVKTLADTFRWLFFCVSAALVKNPPATKPNGKNFERRLATPPPKRGKAMVGGRAMEINPAPAGIKNFIHCGHVLTRKNGQPIRNIGRSLDHALKKAGLEDTRITPHSFRRAAITRWTDLGIPRDVVMAFSGHSPGGNVHDAYIKFTDRCW